MIGGTDCGITAATSTELQCDIGPGPPGNHDVIVTVSGKGLASGSAYFSYLFEADYISPTSGSLAGIFPQTTPILIQSVNSLIY